MVPGEPLPDVVQERSEDEQIGAPDRIGLVGGVGGGLEEVAIHCEAVVGVALVVVAHVLPLGDLSHDEALVVEGFECRDRSVAGGQEAHQGVPGL